MQNLGIDVLFKGKNFLRLLGGLWVAIRISLISVAISIVLGLVMGMLMSAPRTRSPISATPQKLNTMMAAYSADRSQPNTLVVPK